MTAAVTKPIQEKKRHHYVPVSYLQAFCDEQGCLRVFRKVEAGRSLHITPDSIGFRRYYYSQPTPSGAVDNNGLEDTFSETVESRWKPAIEKLHARQTDSDDVLELLFTFLALQRVRVPASRDVTEAKLADSAEGLLKVLNAEGGLPPLPLELVNNTGAVKVAIDPHQSIHGMLEALTGRVASVLERIGLVLGRAIRQARRPLALCAERGAARHAAVAP
jgi:hypothetical protein